MNDKFHIRAIYWDESKYRWPKPEDEDGTLETRLKNIICLAYYEYFDVLKVLKKDAETKTDLLSRFTVIAGNFVMNEMSAFCNKEKIELYEYPVLSNNIIDLLCLVVFGKKIDYRRAMNEMLPELVNNCSESVSEIAERLRIFDAIPEADEIEKLSNEALLKFPDKVADYKIGKLGVINLFVGDVMKASKGKANAKEVKEVLEKLLIQ